MEAATYKLQQCSLHILPACPLSRSAHCALRYDIDTLALVLESGVTLQLATARQQTQVKVAISLQGMEGQILQRDEGRLYAMSELCTNKS